MRFRAGVALLAASTAHAALAVPALDPVFGDHAVIQRDQPIHIRGTAAPSEQLTVGFAGKTVSVRADTQGRWSATFPSLGAGGSYRIDVRSAAGSTAADDVMIGDVWLCSGQSNMEFPLRQALNGEGEVSGAKDPQLRLLKVPRNRSLAPQPSLPAAVGWKLTTPDSAKDFSAACYFMTRRLRDSHKVAIGAIDSTWGGTAIHSWTPDEGVRATGGAREVELLREYRRDPKRTVAAYGERWASWWREHSGDARGREPWRASDSLGWTLVPRIALWETWGLPELANYNGAMWARVRFTLTPAQAAQGATLSLGAIDDFDRTFVNGEAVGQTFMYSKPREYPVRRGLLKAGVNEVLVYVLDTGGGGGFWSPPETLRLTLADGSARPLAQGWEYSLIAPEVGTPPLPPWDDSPGVTTLYNGMIAPVGDIRLKGVAWYQGEADVGRAGYDQRLAAMMKSWREQFGDERLPFLIVGLAGFGHPVTVPAASGWAGLINEQRLAAERDGYAALVSAIDIGERDDIHPPNKQEVGRRLALAAEVLAYRDPKGVLAPKPLRAARGASSITVEFDMPVQSLGGSPIGLELCGETQASCRYVSAEAKGSTVLIAADGQPASRVRYAWADYPIVNLYGPESLPVPPFELSVR